MHRKQRRVQAAVHARDLDEYNKRVVFERAKARAAVAVGTQRSNDGLAKQKLAYDNRLRGQTRIYDKEKVAIEKRHMPNQNQSSQWETWWSGMTIEHRRSIIRKMRFKWQGSSFWDPGVSGQGHEE